MAETIYHVIDADEKRVKWDHYASLDAFMAALSQNPETIDRFNHFYKEITSESFYQEGPKTVEELRDYLIAESNDKTIPRGYNLIASLETRNKNLWFIYQKSREVASSEVKPITVNFLRGLYEMQDASEEEVIQRFQLTVNDYASVNPHKKVKEDIPEITPDFVREWENSPHKDEYATVNDYRRSPRIEGYPVDGIVVANLRTKELRYLCDPGTFTIPRERPTDLDRKFELCKVPYSLPEGWKLIRE